MAQSLIDKFGELLESEKYLSALELLASSPELVSDVKSYLASRNIDFTEWLSSIALLAITKEGADPASVASLVAKIAGGLPEAFSEALRAILLQMAVNNPGRALEVAEKIKSLGVDWVGDVELLARIASNDKLRELLSCEDMTCAARVAREFGEEEWRLLEEAYERGLVTLTVGGRKVSPSDIKRAVEGLEELSKASSLEDVASALEKLKGLPGYERADEWASVVRDLSTVPPPDKAVSLIERLPEWLQSLAAALWAEKARERYPAPAVVKVLERFGVPHQVVKETIPAGEVEAIVLGKGAEWVNELVEALKSGDYTRALEVMEEHRDDISSLSLTIAGREVSCEELYNLLKRMAEANVQDIISKLQTIIQKRTVTPEDAPLLRDLAYRIRSAREVLDEASRLGLIQISGVENWEVLADKLSALADLAEAIGLLENLDKARNPRQALAWLDRAKELLRRASRYYDYALALLELLEGLGGSTVECILAKAGLEEAGGGGGGGGGPGAALPV